MGKFKVDHAALDHSRSFSFWLRKVRDLKSALKPAREMHCLLRRNRRHGLHPSWRAKATCFLWDTAHANRQRLPSPQTHSGVGDSRSWTRALNSYQNFVFPATILLQAIISCQGNQMGISTRDNSVKDRWQRGVGFILSNTNSFLKFLRKSYILEHLKNTKF